MTNHNNQPALLDQDYLQANYHDAGFSYLLPEIFELFLEQTAIYLHRLGELLKQGKIQEMSENAHTLKGAAGSIGATALAEAAEVLEHAVVYADLATTTVLLENLIDLSRLTGIEITAELDKLSAKASKISEES